jgi:hypothetical protein
MSETTNAETHIKFPSPGSIEWDEFIESEYDKHEDLETLLVEAVNQRNAALAREEKLVRALEEIRDRAESLASAIKIARKALEAHRVGKEQK